MRTPHKFTEEQIRYIEENRDTMPTLEIARHINVTIGCLRVLYEHNNWKYILTPKTGKKYNSNKKIDMSKCKPPYTCSSCEFPDCICNKMPNAAETKFIKSALNTNNKRRDVVGDTCQLEVSFLREHIR